MHLRWIIWGGLGCLILAIGFFFLLSVERSPHPPSLAVRCAFHMRRISEGIGLYRNENRRAYPPDLGTVLATQDVSGDMFLCPARSAQLPKNWETMTVEQQSDWVNQHGSYVYLGRAKDAQAFYQDDVLLYESPDNHGGAGLHVVEVQGLVRFQRGPDAGRAIENTTGQNPFLDRNPPKR